MHSALPNAPAGHYHVESVSPHVHVLTQGDVFHLEPDGNVEVIEQSRGVVLVDTGGSTGAAEEVVALIHRITTKPVTAIVYTHWHNDHVSGASRILREWPHARLIAADATRQFMASAAADAYFVGNDEVANARVRQILAEQLERLRARAADPSLTPSMRAHYSDAAAEYERFGRDMFDSPKVVPTESFTSELDLPDTMTPVHLMMLGRANTEGDAVTWLPRERVVVTGDIVVKPIPFGFESYPRDWIDVLQRIKALSPAVIVPGHGEPMRTTAYLDLLAAMITDLRQQAAALANDSSVTPDNAAEHIHLTNYAATFSRGDPWLATWFQRSWEQPMAQNVLREARGLPITQS